MNLQLLTDHAKDSIPFTPTISTKPNWRVVPVVILGLAYEGPTCIMGLVQKGMGYNHQKLKDFVILRLKIDAKSIKNALTNQTATLTFLPEHI